MRRNPIQDIKRSTPSIHSASSSQTKNTKRSKKELEAETVKEAPTFEERIEDVNFGLNTRPHKPTHNFKWKTTFIISSLLAFIALLYVGSLYLGQARVYITEKREQFSFTDKSFSAVKTSQENLSFEVMSISDSVEKSITLSESKQMSSKAKGVAVIYNEFSTTVQKLAINTRLSDDQGNIYLTDKALTVPGYTTSKGKIVPGSISVGITASNAGEKYNGDPRDFSIVGFKGTNKATKIYARSKGPISGGATGLVYTPSPEERGELSAFVLGELKSKLERSIQAQVPPGYFLIKDSLKIDTNFNPDNVLSKTKDAQISFPGNAFAIIMKERDLEEHIIKSLKSDISKEELIEISIPEIKNFVIKITQGKQALSKDTTNIDFTLSGEGTLSWQPNFETLKKSLIGIKKSESKKVFKQDPGIESARLVLIPIWQKSLPKNPNFIKVKSAN